MLHTTHHDKVDEGNSVGMDIKHSHRAQHVCNDTTDSEQDDNGCPNIETQEENAHQKYSTCRRGYRLLMGKNTWRNGRVGRRRRGSEVGGR